MFQAMKSAALLACAVISGAAVGCGHVDYAALVRLRHAGEAACPESSALRVGSGAILTESVQTLSILRNG